MDHALPGRCASRGNPRAPSGGQVDPGNRQGAGHLKVGGATRACKSEGWSMRALQRTVPPSLTLESDTAGQSSEKRDTEQGRRRDSRQKVLQLWGFLRPAAGHWVGQKRGQGVPRGWDSPRGVGHCAMSNRRIGLRKPVSTPPTEEADPLHGLDSPEAIAALEKAAAELVRGTNLSPDELVRGLLANEGDRQAIERGFAQIQHNLEHGINTLRVQFAEPRNTAEARVISRALQRLSKARLIFNEDPHDLTRFADRRQSQPGKADFGRERRSLPHRPDRRGR